jgi:phosphatidylinositol-3-phosphatase
VDQIYDLAAGKHTTTVTDLNSSYKLLHESTVTYDVEALSGLQVISPVPGQTFDSTTVHVVAEAQESVPVSQMQVWDNGVKLGHYSGSSVNAYFNLAPGSHTITVTDLDDQWNVIHWISVGYSVK